MHEHQLSAGDHILVRGQGQKRTYRYKVASAGPNHVIGERPERESVYFIWSFGEGVKRSWWTIGFGHVTIEKTDDPEEQSK